MAPRRLVEDGEALEGFAGQRLERNTRVLAVSSYVMNNIKEILLGTTKAFTPKLLDETGYITCV